LWLNRIKLKNFRNYESVEVIFEKGINYLFGVNGVGKTNLIEAIYYISNLRSFRTSDDKNLIKDLKKDAEIEATINELDYSLKINKDKKMLSIDGIIYQKHRDYIGKVNVVEFCPEEVYLLKDFPKDRRRFLDREISKLDYKYLNDMLVYNKLIKQRNELLRSRDSYKNELIEVIDEKISDLQVYLINKRKWFLKELEKTIKGFKVSISDIYDLNLVYQCDFKEINKDKMIDEYKNSFAKDQEKGMTSLGVHKEDFKIYINGNDASNYGSQGEQRILVLLMKLALVKLVEKEIGKCPILVLDDMFSELDENRRKEVYEILKTFKQVFITGCDKKDIKGVTNCVSYEIKENDVKRIKEE